MYGGGDDLISVSDTSITEDFLWAELQLLTDNIKVHEEMVNNRAKDMQTSGSDINQQETSKNLLMYSNSLSLPPRYRLLLPLLPFS